MASPRFSYKIGVWLLSQIGAEQETENPRASCHDVKVDNCFRDGLLFIYFLQMLRLVIAPIQLSLLK
jgi:hypothetical protein